jgi:hypothetical protein
MPVFETGAVTVRPSSMSFADVVLTMRAWNEASRARPAVPVGLVAVVAVALRVILETRETGAFRELKVPLALPSPC